MKNWSAIAMALLVIGLTVLGCSSQKSGQGDAGWITLLDGSNPKTLDNWNRLGDANWRAEDGAIVADKGKGGYLVSKDSYKDFLIYAEFWAETDTNSGIFIRASDPNKVGAASAYEVNIWDIRPDPTYATGAIVDFARVPVPIVHKAGGRWNTYEVYAKDANVSVKFNGVLTVSMQNGKFANGPFALQYGAGVKGATGGAIKWRKVQIKPL